MTWNQATVRHHYFKLKLFRRLSLIMCLSLIMRLKVLYKIEPRADCNKITKLRPKPQSKHVHKRVFKFKQISCLGKSNFPVNHEYAWVLQSYRSEWFTDLDYFTFLEIKNGRWNCRKEIFSCFTKIISQVRSRYNMWTILSLQKPNVIHGQIFRASEAFQITGHPWMTSRNFKHY